LAKKSSKKGAGDMSDLISQAEAARRRGVTVNAIGDLIRRGRLRSVEVAGRTLVYASDVEGFEKEKPGPKGKGGR
jgi:hypothetical protein